MSGAVKSDGGSSSYYDIPVPNWLLDRLADREVDDSSFIKTEELIEIMFGNDFDFGNVLKCLVRLYGTTQGAGKAGNDADYEINKMVYSLNEKIRKRQHR